jgi:hypothetical protein
VPGQRHHGPAWTEERTASRRVGGSPRRASTSSPGPASSWPWGQKQIAAAMGVPSPGYPRSSTARLPPSRPSPATSRPLDAGWTWSPVSVTGPSGCPSATPQPPHESDHVPAPRPVEAT